MLPDSKSTVALSSQLSLSITSEKQALTSTVLRILADLKSATTPRDLYDLNSIKYNGEYISMKFNAYNL